MVALVLLLAGVAAAPARAEDHLAGSYRFDRAIDQTVTDGTTQRRLVREDHWTVTLDDYPANTDIADGTISGSVTYRVEENGAVTRSGTFTGSGPLETRATPEADGTWTLSSWGVNGIVPAGEGGLPGAEGGFRPAFRATVVPGEASSRSATVEAADNLISGVDPAAFPRTGTPLRTALSTVAVANPQPERSRVSLKVTPRRDLKPPLRFRAAGRVAVGAGATPYPVAGCAGRLSVTVKRFHRVLVTKRVRLTSCRYKLPITVPAASLPVFAKLTVRARFAPDEGVAGNSRKVRVKVKTT